MSGAGASKQLGSRRKRIVLGVCAMEKKTASKPMREILRRLPAVFEIVVFDERMICEDAVEVWPRCDCLIAFHSRGFPLEKAKAYEALVKPFVLNDLRKQDVLRDRRLVYKTLQAAGVPMPRHVCMSRDWEETGGVPPQTFEEFDDYIIVNGTRMEKPFVEKPVDSDDHNINIYYPMSAGGGSKKLFRKVDNISSAYYADAHSVRRDGSYLYEEFLDTQGTDVKVYAVGPYYGHAEARKSPALDGIVMRGGDGKELRYPVILSWIEKDIAFKVYHAFKQTVCGFDILRTPDGKTLVCDVNGWSFVKKSRKYYDDCAALLAELMEHGHHGSGVGTSRAAEPALGARAVSGDAFDRYFSGDERTLPDEGGRGRGASVGEDEVEAEERPSGRSLDSQSGTTALGATRGSKFRGEPGCAAASPDAGETSTCELRCVIAVVRHGDRTPKRKLKVRTTHPALVAMHKLHAKSPKHEGKIKESQDLHAFKTLVTEIIAATEDSNSLESEDAALELCKLRDVLEQHVVKQLGDRADCDSSAAQSAHEKAKTKDREHKDSEHRKEARNLEGEPESTRKDSKKDKPEKKPEKSAAPPSPAVQEGTKQGIIMSMALFSGCKLQLKPSAWDEHDIVTEIVLVLKWGGVLTELGVRQSTALGAHFRREMYPASEDGAGLLRLHATFRHDLKIRTSDEGRVMKTGAAFTKGLLELEGDISPILVSLIHRGRSDVNMLDRAGNHEAQELLRVAKTHVERAMQVDLDFGDSTGDEDERARLARLIAPDGPESVLAALHKLGNPRHSLEKLFELVDGLIKALEGQAVDADRPLYMGETFRIWRKGRVESLLDFGDDHSPNALEIRGVFGPRRRVIPERAFCGLTRSCRLESWRDVRKELRRKAKKGQGPVFDLSKIPEIFDKVRFDARHNARILAIAAAYPRFQDLVRHAQTLSSAVTPLEFGGAADLRRDTAWRISRALLDKICLDLQTARGVGGDLNAVQQHFFKYTLSD